MKTETIFRANGLDLESLGQLIEDVRSGRRVSPS